MSASLRSISCSGGCPLSQLTGNPLFARALQHPFLHFRSRLFECTRAVLDGGQRGLVAVHLVSCHARLAVFLQHNYTAASGRQAAACALIIKWVAYAGLKVSTRAESNCHRGGRAHLAHVEYASAFSCARAFIKTKTPGTPEMRSDASEIANKIDLIHTRTQRRKRFFLCGCIEDQCFISLDAIPSAGNWPIACSIRSGFDYLALAGF